MTYNLTSAEVVDIRRLMLAGCATDDERARAERYAETISMALGERDAIARGLEGSRAAFERYVKRVEEIDAEYSKRVKAMLPAHCEADDFRMLDDLEASGCR